MLATQMPHLLTDFYKECHWQQYNPEITKLYSYYTPRGTRTSRDTVVFFGLQYYIKEYLINGFNKYFFSRPKEEVIAEYERIMSYTLSNTNYDSSRWVKLHDLGYLPLCISAIPEGTVMPVKVPMIEITNTHDDFAWLVNTIETSMSSELWHIMTAATIGDDYYKIAKHFYDKTVDGNIPIHTAICDFSMRGNKGVEAAITDSAAFLTSFSKTATIPAIMFLEEFYNCNVENELVATGLASTEHSVMCSSKAIDGDEETLIYRLLSDTYKDENFTMVLDSYDFWNAVTNILTIDKIRNCVIERGKRGKFVGIRGDSGDPVKIIAGNELSTNKAEHDGLVETLFNIFGGKINNKGYIVLNDGIRAVYGDSITPARANAIYTKLEENRFAANNVLLGMGSYSLMSAENNTPLTRDTFNVAIKTTHCEISSGEEFPIYKQPKTDDGMKFSAKGIQNVIYNENTKQYELVTSDNKYNMAAEIISEFKNVFYNGQLITEYSLNEIRGRLHDDFWTR